MIYEMGESCSIRVDGRWVRGQVVSVSSNGSMRIVTKKHLWHVPKSKVSSDVRKVSVV
jgi:hypothetical protein